MYSKIQLIIISLASFICLQTCSQTPAESEEEVYTEPDFLKELRNQRRQIPSFGTYSDSLSKIDPLDFSALTPLHEEMDESNLTDWERRFESTPQDLETYLADDPIRPTKNRPFIFVGKLGDFSPAQNEIFRLTCIYLQGFFGCEVKFFDSIPMSEVPDHAKRTKNGNTQLYTRYFLNKVLKPRLPDSALNCLLLTTEDLYPASSWNFVFGQASLKNRVGIWSMNRFGNPDLSRDTFDLCLRRTLKTAAHETGHMFSIKHCTFYYCTMQGAYHLQEADDRPMFLCPVCLSKISSSGHIDVLKRFEFLKKFWGILGFEEEYNSYKRFKQSLSS